MKFSIMVYAVSGTSLQFVNHLMLEMYTLDSYVPRLITQLELNLCFELRIPLLFPDCHTIPFFLRL
jgi:hypothetical protein